MKTHYTLREVGPSLGHLNAWSFAQADAALIPVPELMTCKEHIITGTCGYAFTLQHIITGTCDYAFTLQHIITGTCDYAFTVQHIITGTCGYAFTLQYA
jgi:hypothetical protein